MQNCSNVELLFLHALPLDGSMWANHMDLLPGSTFAPTLYSLGDSAEEWATEALRLTRSDRLIVVGCSVGGSCALEVAAIAPERVAALVLIGTKAAHRPDPAFCALAVDLIENKGIDAAWIKYWAPLFSEAADSTIVERARQIALRLPPEDVARGVSVFHSRRSRDQLVAEWQHPIIIVTGEDDVAPGLETSITMANSAPEGCLHVIPFCGHYVPLESPKALRAILNNLIDTQISVT